jgi:hypothetical protein
MNLPGKILVARTAVALAALAGLGAVAWVARGPAPIPAGEFAARAAAETAPAAPAVASCDVAVSWPDPPDGSGLFEGRRAGGTVRREESATDENGGIGLRLVGVVGAGDARIGLFLPDGGGGTRVGGVGTRFADRGVTVVGWREAEESGAATGAVAARLRRERDGRMLELVLESAEAPKP